jgi:membrane associated rhomboid family serine protease
MVFYEHWALLLCGLVCGVIAALVAVGPAILSPTSAADKSPGAAVPYFSLTLTIVAIVVSGIVWIWMATVFALSGKMLEALRNE